MGEGLPLKNFKIRLASALVALAFLTPTVTVATAAPSHAATYVACYNTTKGWPSGMFMQSCLIDWNWFQEVFQRRKDGEHFRGCHTGYKNCTDWSRQRLYYT